MSKYDSADIHRYADGQWIRILSSLAPQLSHALEKPGKHVPHPLLGGKDGFRVFKDVDETGGGVSNRDGVFSDGIALLMWLHNWSFGETIDHIGDFLGIEPRPMGRSASKTEVEEFDAKAIDCGTDDRSPWVAVEKPDGSKLRIRGEKVLQSWKSSLVEPGEKLFVRRIRHVEKGTESIDWIFLKKKAKARNPERDLELAQKIEEVWNASLPYDPRNMEMRPMLDYLENRGISTSEIAGSDLRFHPSLPCWVEGENGEESRVLKFPAMVAAVRSPEGGIVTLHRTYLDPGKGAKADVPAPKKLMALPEGCTMTGGAIRLAPICSDRPLGLAEGIETALAVETTMAIPCWALVSAGNLERFVPPEGVKRFIIWADLDRSLTGQSKAMALAARLADSGLEVAIATPSGLIAKGSKGIDWNDVLKAHGPDGFPFIDDLFN